MEAFHVLQMQTDTKHQSINNQVREYFASIYSLWIGLNKLI